MKKISSAYNVGNVYYSEYSKYFNFIRSEYEYRLNLILSLINSIKNVDIKFKDEILKDLKLYLNKKQIEYIIKGTNE